MLKRKAEGTIKECARLLLGITFYGKLYTGRQWNSRERPFHSRAAGGTGRFDG